MPPGGKVVDDMGKTVHLEPKTGSHGEPIFQTTVQRWLADPLVADHYACEAGGGIRGNPNHAHHACQDRTIRTVFTHDHFGPSSIQQHGFYSALLVEPAGSEWLKPTAIRCVLRVLRILRV